MRILPFLLGASLFAFIARPALAADDKVIVHEWGTFTCLQDEQGNAIKGMNIDDEPVPSFVCDQHAVNVVQQYSSTYKNFGLPPYQSYHNKGWSPGDPQVTMRLETPVLYFYPPKDKKSVGPLDVQVDFHDGMLSQYYPYATLDVADRSTLSSLHAFVTRIGDLAGMTSTLKWRSVILGSSAKPIDTEDKVWTTPREVGAPVLEVKAPVFIDGNVHMASQAEHFLFYRGVGHLDSPVSLSANNPPSRRTIWTHNGESGLDESWLVEIRPDGACAFRYVAKAIGMETEATNVRMSMSEQPGFGNDTLRTDFSGDDFSADNLAKLKSLMHNALVRHGLYDDEATAMLKTWELSYFKSSGLRFFYIVPRAWVNKTLPLQITGAPTEVTRVMVGRIELITDAQKEALARLAAGPCPDLASVKQAAAAALEKGQLPKEQVEAFYRGDKALSELGITIPPLVQDYLSLSRFRDALIVHEQELHPSSSLAQFIKDNQLISQQD